MAFPWLTMASMAAGTYMVIVGNILVKIVGIILMFGIVGVNVYLKVRK